MRAQLGLLCSALLAAAAAGGAVALAGQPVTWRWPLAGQPVVCRVFDPPPLPWAAGHRGVDLRARDGDAVVAAGPGVVGFAGTLAGRGVVAVHHAGGLETTYEPLRVLVHAGQRVGIGQLLGRVVPGHGDCGLGFVCLHWGLRRADSYLDPLSLLRSDPIRLLPVWSGPAPSRQVQPAAVSERRAAAEPSPQHRTRGPTVGVAAAAVAGAGGAVALAAARRRRRPSGLSARVAARS
jgi:hypothetical protein